MDFRDDCLAGRSRGRDGAADPCEHGAYTRDAVGDHADGGVNNHCVGRTYRRPGGNIYRDVQHQRSKPVPGEVDLGNRSGVDVGLKQRDRVGDTSLASRAPAAAHRNQIPGIILINDQLNLVVGLCRNLRAVEKLDVLLENIQVQLQFAAAHSNRERSAVGAEVASETDVGGYRAERVDATQALLHRDSQPTRVDVTDVWIGCRCEPHRYDVQDDTLEQ